MGNFYKKIKYFLVLLAVLCLVACKKESISPAPTETIIIPTKTISIVVLGSSTAAGTGASPASLGWVGRIQTKLANDSKNAKVINLALAGFTSYNILPTGYAVAPGRPMPDSLRNISKALTYKPDLVIINLPTNDIASLYTDDEILSNFRAVSNLLDNSQIPYIVTGTQPRNFATYDQRKRLKTLNDKLRNMYPNSIEDFLERLSEPTWEILSAYSFGDGVHLNNQGHLVIFESIASNSIFKRVLGY